MSTFSDFVGYFENIAKNHKSIAHTASKKHFCRMELEEILGGMKTGVNFPVLVLETYEYGFEDQYSDNVLKSRVCAFMVLDSPANRGDFDANVLLMSDIEVIVDEILRVMMLHKADPFNHAVVRDFDINTVEVLPVMNGPDGSYGFRASFTMKGGFNADVTASKWTSTKF